eukprot:Cvel_28753.t1-p1 / transcript=Cvel_28753.t1 / gene=Cvel_28753 / organism=Chromera_velia_CCMP2878 / gene_product=Fibrillin-1, putative / transcript_product=Fibrillin-1, putative / location=Cvel_scaffold3824:711-3151(-) / protein_length=369 / sequence_SO=supercontig / SO=protein_coding / is_pseudo=false
MGERTQASASTQWYGAINADVQESRIYDQALGWTDIQKAMWEMQDLCQTDIRMYSCTGANQKCVHLPSSGSFMCDCNDGFFGVGGCDMEYPCFNGTQICDQHASCNLDWFGDEHFSCTCNAGWTGNGFTCTDVDECSSGSHTCSDHPGTSCVNSEGSFECMCEEGFYGEGALCTKWKFPPTDIGPGPEFWNDNTDQYNGWDSEKMMVAGPVCPDMYRVASNYATCYGETPSYAFDGHNIWTDEAKTWTACPGDYPGRNTTTPDGDIHIVISLPCAISVEAFQLETRNDGPFYQGASKVKFHGGHTNEGPWTLIGSVDKIPFSASGPFSYLVASSSNTYFSMFRLDALRASSDENWPNVGMIEIGLLSQT